MDALFERLLRVTPWITIVLPAVVVTVICVLYLPSFITFAVPVTLGILFALILYSVLR